MIGGSDSASMFLKPANAAEDAQKAEKEEPARHQLQNLWRIEVCSKRFLCTIAGMQVSPLALYGSNLKFIAKAKTDLEVYHTVNNQLKYVGLWITSNKYKYISSKDEEIENRIECDKYSFA